MAFSKIVFTHISVHSKMTGTVLDKITNLMRRRNDQQSLYEAKRLIDSELSNYESRAKSIELEKQRIGRRILQLRKSKASKSMIETEMMRLKIKNQELTIVTRNVSVFLNLQSGLNLSEISITSVESLSRVTTALKSLKVADLDTVEKATDETHELMDNMLEITEAVSKPMNLYATDFVDVTDDNQLDLELEALGVGVYNDEEPIITESKAPMRSLPTMNGLTAISSGPLRAKSSDERFQPQTSTQLMSLPSVPPTPVVEQPVKKKVDPLWAAM